MKTEGVQRTQIEGCNAPASTRHSRTRRNMWCYACFARTKVQDTCRLVPVQQRGISSVLCVPGQSAGCVCALRKLSQSCSCSHCIPVTVSTCEVSHAGLMSHAATCRSRARVRHRATSTRLVIMSRQDTAGTHRASTQSTPGTWFQGDQLRLCLSR